MATYVNDNYFFRDVIVSKKEKGEIYYYIPIHVISQIQEGICSLYAILYFIFITF